MFRIVIDALCFQIDPNSAKSIFWEHLLDAFDEHLTQEKFSDFSIVVLVRGPSLHLRHKNYANLMKLPISFYDYRFGLSDWESLGNFCQSISANLFVSTHYSIAYGVPNIGFLDCVEDSEGHSYERKQRFLLQSIYLKSLPKHVLLSNALKWSVLRSFPGTDPDSLVCCRPPMFPTGINSLSRNDGIDSKNSIGFPFILFADSSIESIFTLLSECFSSQSDPSTPLSIGVLIHSHEKPPTSIPEELSSMFEFGIHIMTIKADLMPLLFQSALLCVFHAEEACFPYHLICSLYHGCPVACLDSSVTKDILSCVDDSDYVCYQPNALSKIRDYVQCMIDSRHQVSRTTISKLAQMYALNNAGQLLIDLQRWSSGLASPLDFYLPKILPLEGIKFE